MKDLKSLCCSSWRLFPSQLSAGVYGVYGRAELTDEVKSQVLAQIGNQQRLYYLITALQTLMSAYNSCQCLSGGIMIDISKISSLYDIRRLNDPDADSILSICQKNTQFYEYCEAEPTREQVLNDLHITPPGIGLSDKYYIGFYRGKTLIAVMDLIDGYPEPEIAYIGFFMMNKDLQGQGIGTAIIRETASYLRTTGKTGIRLAIDKGNPQSTNFWKKNGFIVIKEVDRNGRTALVAEKKL